MRTTDLTKRQLVVIRYIHYFLKTEGRSPTLREIANGLGLSAVSTIHKHIQHLIDKGFLDRSHGKGNNIILINRQESSNLENSHLFNGIQNIKAIAFYGDVAAGAPIFPESNTSYLDVPAYIRQGRQELFALRVSGDSMVDDSIIDGDLIVLQRRINYHNGDRVVALIDNDEATFKELRIDKSNNGIWLIPHNVNFTSQYFSYDRVIIQGALIAVMRSC